MQNYFKSGTHNIICDVCGFKFKSDEVRTRWDGLVVCNQDFEYDHPQKHIRVRETGLAVDPIRPDAILDTYEFICYIYAIQAYAGLAEAGCAKAGSATSSYAFLLSIKNGAQ